MLSCTSSGAGMGNDPADEVLAQTAGKISCTLKENAQQHH
jgi:hypothetical protein